MQFTSRYLRAAVAAAVGFTVLIAVASPASAGTPPPLDAEGKVYAGIYPGPTDIDGVDHNGFHDLPVLESFDTADNKVTFAGRFHDVYESVSQVDGYNTKQPLEYAWQGEATPFSNVWISDTAANIAAGAHDAGIADWVADVKSWLDRGGSRSLIVAPLLEANGDWTPFGCDPANFKIAYRKFVDAFRAAGVDGTQVRFSFTPNGWTPPGCGTLADYYPGHDYVDVIAISGYNFSGVSGSPWSTPYQAFSGPVEELRAIAPTKPFLAGQTGSPSAGGDKNQWIRDLFAYVAADRNMVGFVYFNISKVEGSPPAWVDWEVASGGATGWRGGMATAAVDYQWPLTDWFHTGDLMVAPSGLQAPACGDGLDCDSIGFVDPGARFHLMNETVSTTAMNRFYFGNPGDFPVMGDWDCDGTKTPGQYRQADGFVYLRNSNTSGVGEIKFFFGNPGDIPIVGDFNGDGCDTVSIYRPSQGRIFIINRLGEDNGGLGAADISYYFGNPGDKPFVGDFDGDGKDTVGLHRESNGLVYFNNEHRSKNADMQFTFGNPGDKIVAGDWNGNGKDSPALYRKSSGYVYLRFANSTGVADRAYYVGTNFDSAIPAPHM